jgi:hypothetical protein
MLTVFIKIIVLLAVIIIPLIPKKEKKKAIVPLKIDSDTSHAEYAVDEKGNLEKINQLV